jgi:hypothetical protein
MATCFITHQTVHIFNYLLYSTITLYFYQCRVIATTIIIIVKVISTHLVSNASLYEINQKKTNL